MAQEIHIHDDNAHLWADETTVDGEKKSKGYVPRDFNLYPRSMLPAFAPPSEITVYDQADWGRIADEMVQSQSRLSDIRNRGNGGKRIPSLDQGQVGYCATADTEILTDKGFVPWPEYNWQDQLATVNTDSGMMEFQNPTRKHVYEYNGNMIYSTNRRVDFGMTPDHRMLVRKWNQRKGTLSRRYTFQKAGELGWYCGLMAAPKGHLGTELIELGIPEDRHYDGDDLLAMLALVVSDGYAGGSESTKNWVSFCCFHEGRYGMVSALAQRLGFKESPSRRGVWTRYSAGALAEWIRTNCYVGNKYTSVYKKLPDLVKVASRRQIKHFLNFFGDQNHSGPSTHLYSSSRNLIDGLQDLYLRIGRRGTITRNDARDIERRDGVIIHSKESYELHVSETDRLCLERKKHIETDRYKGLVYCATVPNGTLITRRNGTVLISGNCWAHSPTSAATLVRATNNQKYVPLSAYAIAATIKKGADEGGWCGLSAEFARTKGIPSQAMWPQGDSNYRNYQSKQEVWDNAKLHVTLEDYVDLTKDVYDQNMAFAQVITCLLNRVPCPSDFNWWSHSVCACDAVNGASQRPNYRVDSGKLATLEEFERHWGTNNPVTAGMGIRIWNSWGDSWSDNGMGTLAGSKAVPDGAVAIRVMPFANE